VPFHLVADLEPGEYGVASIHGGSDAGILVTNHRVIARRGRGRSRPMALRLVDRVQLDIRPDRQSLLLLVASDAETPPLALALAPIHLPGAEAFVRATCDAAQAAHAAGGRRAEVEQGRFGTMTIFQIHEV
jgi:hypothetical protein